MELSIFNYFYHGKIRRIINPVLFIQFCIVHVAMFERGVCVEYLTLYNAYIVLN